MRNIEDRCSHCHVNPYPEKLLRCGFCKTTQYCNASCQRAHWKAHKGECKRVKAKLAKEKDANVKATAKAEADKLSSGTTKNEDVKILVNNEKVILSRAKDKSDGFVYSNFMPGPQYGQFIQSTKPECWCGDVGLQQSLLVVFPFDIAGLPKRGGYVKSQFLNAPFGAGVNFQLHISEMMGNISIDLSEEAKQGVSLDSVDGVQARATYWFCKGGDAMQLVLPPPSKGKFKRAGEQVCNSHMNCFCGVGQKIPLGLHEIKLVPRVSGKVRLINSAVSSQIMKNTKPSMYFEKQKQSGTSNE